MDKLLSQIFPGDNMQDQYGNKYQIHMRSKVHLQWPIWGIRHIFCIIQLHNMTNLAYTKSKDSLEMLSVLWLNQRLNLRMTSGHRSIGPCSLKTSYLLTFRLQLHSSNNPWLFQNLQEHDNIKQDRFQYLHFCQLYLDPYPFAYLLYHMLF